MVVVVLLEVLEALAVLRVIHQVSLGQLQLVLRGVQVAHLQVHHVVAVLALPTYFIPILVFDFCDFQVSPFERLGELFVEQKQIRLLLLLFAELLVSLNVVFF